MSDILPRRNLPPEAEPWGRGIQKLLTDLLKDVAKTQSAATANQARHAGILGAVAGQAKVIATQTDVIDGHEAILLPVAAPEAPTPPSLTSQRGSITAVWDGELVNDEGVSAPPTTGFKEVFAEIAEADSATPETIWTRVGQPLTDAGDTVITDLPVGARRWVRFVAASNSGLTSRASADASIVVTGVATEDLDESVAGAISDAKSAADTATSDALEAAQKAEQALSQVEKTIQTSLDEYFVSSSSTTPPPAGAAWSSDTPDWTPGEYVWRRTKNTHIDGSISYSSPAVITGADGAPGEDAVLLRIFSTRGTAFKNNAISTTLYVVVYAGARQITTLTDLRAELGTTAFLEWRWRRSQDSEFGVISSADPRLSLGGFALTISPAEVDQQTLFECHLRT
ncbi:MAG: phage minor structural protein [Microbacterium sp.]|nr:phage minor structural protein [Microbacterium sp.]